MKRLDNFIKDLEVRPLTFWQCSTLSGGTWVDGDFKKKEEEKKGKEKEKEVLKFESDTLLVAEFQLEDKTLMDPPGQCPHM